MEANHEPLDLVPPLMARLMSTVCKSKKLTCRNTYNESKRESDVIWGSKHLVSPTYIQTCLQQQNPQSSAKRTSSQKGMQKIACRRQQTETFFPHYWPFVRRIHRSPVNSPHKGQWRGALMFSLSGACTNGWVNNRDAGDLRHHRDHYDVTVMANRFMGFQRSTHYVCTQSVLVLVGNILSTFRTALNAKWLKYAPRDDKQWYCSKCVHKALLNTWPYFYYIFSKVLLL